MSDHLAQTPSLDGVTPHVIHASLYRPLLFLGVEQPIVVLEAMMIFALLVGIGLHLSTIALATGVVMCLHPLLAWLTSHDPDISRVYVRSLTASDYYPAQSPLQSRSPSVRTSIPDIR